MVKIQQTVERKPDVAFDSQLLIIDQGTREMSARYQEQFGAGKELLLLWLNRCLPWHTGRASRKPSGGVGSRLPTRELISRLWRNTTWWSSGWTGEEDNGAADSGSSYDVTGAKWCASAQVRAVPASNVSDIEWHGDAVHGSRRGCTLRILERGSCPVWCGDDAPSGKVPWGTQIHQ